jgi:hypothetical protein
MNADQLENKKEKIIYRLFEILPGTLSWTTIIGSIVLSFIRPTWVAVFIICFDVYWLIKVGYLGFYLLSAYKKLKNNLAVDWLKLCQKKFNNKWEKMYHLVIIPTYKENFEILKPSFKALAESNYPKSRMIVVFTYEGRDSVEGKKNAEKIKNLYGHNFKYFLITEHPKDLKGEIAGKGSNEAWAAKKAQEIIDSNHIPYENIILSTLDSDTCVHRDFFGCLTYKFLENPKPHNASYQPVPMFFNNFWQSSLLMRLIGLNTTFWNMMEQVRPEKLYTFSSHSMSFKTLIDIGFWEKDVVSEDSRIFWQCFLHFNGDYKTVPLMIPVYMDVVSASSYWKSVKNQYKQQRRWAYGAENVPYVMFNFMKNKYIPKFKKLIHSFWLIEGFHSWATNAIIIFMLGWLPLILGGEKFTHTLLAQNLPYITQILMTLAMVGMVISATVSFLIINIQKEKNKKIKKRRFFSLLVQWVFLPISTIFLGSFPALDSQTRLMFGKYMGFWVTEKTRK